MENDIKKEIEIGEYEAYYGHDFWCGNCGERNHRYIKKGKSLDTVAFDCDKCGCMINGRKFKA